MKTFRQWVEEIEENKLTPEQEQEIIDFVSNTPNLNDEDFHKFAKSIGVNPHKAEEVIYRHMREKL